MAKPQQTTTELSRTLAGKWSKSEKRAYAARSIQQANQNIRAINRAFRTNQLLNK